MAGYYDRDRRNDTVRPAGTMNHPITHHGNTAEYQAAGFPWVYTTAGAPSNTKISFPYVTQWIILSSAAANVSVAFRSDASNDTTGHAMKFIVNQDAGPIRIPVRCTDIWISAGGVVSIMAGLTGVSRSQFPDITGIEGVKTATINGTLETPGPA